MNYKILVAEDDQAILEVIKIILEGEGYSIITTDSEQVIRKMVNDDPPALILLDIWLAGHDGGKIAKDIKDNKKTAYIPIILISANNETEKIAKDAGANGFLLKPFDIDELLQIVEKYVPNKKNKSSYV